MVRRKIVLAVILILVSMTCVCEALRAEDENLEKVRSEATRGNADAQAQLAYLYQVGEGVTPDYGEAAKWNKKAADQGHAIAQSNLAYMYWKAIGVPADCEEAVRLYRESAGQGWMEAQHNLGMLYLEGSCGPVDYMNAYIWVNIAYYQGSKASKAVMDKIAREMSPDQIEDAQLRAAGMWEDIRKKKRDASRNTP